MALSIIAVWLAVAFISGSSFFVIPNQSLLRFGGATEAAIAAGQSWRLVTSQFLHVYLLHALLNAAAVLIAGSALERRIGVWRLLSVYFVSGIAGQLVAVNVAPAVVATGASQAALGVSGALLVIAAKERRTASAIAPLIYVIAQAALDLSFGGTIKLPHIAGLVAGLLFGVFLTPRALQL